jgi:hypothetical protein
VLVATKEGFREARVHFRLDDQGDADRREVDIELEPLGPRAAVRGKLSGPDGEAVPGETVYLQSPSLDARYTAKTDGEGRFALADVQVGKDYRLWVYPQSGFKDHSRSDFEVPPEGIEVEIPLEAAAVGTLRGILADPDGRPVPRFTLWLRSLKALGRSLPLTSDAAGRFEVENVPEGDLIFETRSLPRFAVRGVQLAGGDEKDLTLVLDWGTHVAAGSVVDERGAPVAGAQVSLNWAQSAGGAQSSSFRNAVTDAAGRFSVSELAAGDHKLSVTSPDHGSVHVQYDVGAGAADPVIVVKEKRR